MSFVVADLRWRWTLRCAGQDDDDPIENLKAFLRSKLGPDDYKTLEGLVAKIGGGKEPDELSEQGALTGHEKPLGGEDDVPD